MMPLVGIYLMLAVGANDQVGFQRYETIQQCNAAARAYAQEQRYSMVRCVENPAILMLAGSRPSDVFDMMGGIIRQLERR